MKPPEIPEFISHYKILSVLGKGGMGIVYLGEDSRLKRRVAIKSLYRQHSKELTERLRREARVLAKLNHPNIVQIYDVVENTQGFFLVMEYVEGRSLSHYLKENQLSQRQKLALLVQILDGLAVAHRRGIIHRDLKPDNILIDAHGRAKIGDFGIAKRQDGDTVELTKHNNISGSLLAMSPEQIKGGSLTAASDIFSFGILAWQVLRECHPFKADTELLVVEKILNDQRPSLKGPDLPLAYTDCLDATLSKEPSQRPNDILGMIKILKSQSLELSDVAEDETLTIYGGVFKARSSNGLWLKFATLMSGIVLLLFLATELYSSLRSEPEPVYAAILPPVLNAQDKLNYNDVEQTIYYALQEGIIDLDNSFLIPSSEVDSYKSEPEQIFSALGADVVISSTISCQDLRCDLHLQREQNNKEIKSRDVHLIDNKLLEVHRIVQLNLAELFPGRDGLLSLSEVISEDNYKKYINFSSMLKEDEGNVAKVKSGVGELIEDAPNFEPLYELYVEAGLDQFSETEEQSHADQVISMLEKAEDSKIDAKKIQVLWVEAYAELGQPELALEKIKPLEKSYGKDRKTEVLKGLIFEKLQNYSEAIKHYQLANDMRPSVKTFRDIAISYWYLGDVKAAIRSLNKALKINPKDIHAGLSLATFYMTSGDLDKAEELFLRYEERSKVSSTYSNIGLTYMLKRDYLKAEKYFLLARDSTSDQDVSRLNLADTYLLSGKIDQAQKQYQMVIDSYGGETDVQGLVNVCQAYMHTGQIKKALATLKTIKEISPNNSDVIYAEAMIYTKLSDFSSAIVAIEKSLDLGAGKVWYGLSWFDPLCTHPEYGPRFSDLTGNKCSS